MTTLLDGCPECGMVYSTVFHQQYHRADCPGLKRRVMARIIPVAHITHDCEENAFPYQSNGALGHGWECGICGKFLQAG